MFINIKNSIRLFGISIIVCCAVTVCTMFLNYYFDITAIKDVIVDNNVRIFYNAQVATSKIVCIVSGGCLLATSVVMLCFYIKHYIDLHRKDIGILKTLGYSNFKIAKSFSVFSLSVFTGAAAGFLIAFLIIPEFYRIQNGDGILPNIDVDFHISLFVYMIILPTVFFALLAVIYAYFCVKTPIMYLLKEKSKIPKRHIKSFICRNDDIDFLKCIKINNLKNHKILTFFIIFASFCFSAMTQMSFSMKELSSVMMAVMIMVIGIILACTTLFMAITTAVKGNLKTNAIMNSFGYTHKSCINSTLGIYRKFGYIGFIAGTIYQYALLKIMVSVVFDGIAERLEYNFNFKAMLISFVFYILFYETAFYLCSVKSRKVTLKEIMLDV